MAGRGRPKGYRLSKESKEKIAKTKTGQRHSTETKARIATSVKQYFKENPMEKRQSIIPDFAISPKLLSRLTLPLLRNTSSGKVHVQATPMLHGELELTQTVCGSFRHINTNLYEPVFDEPLITCGKCVKKLVHLRKLEIKASRNNGTNVDSRNWPGTVNDVQLLDIKSILKDKPKDMSLSPWMYTSAAELEQFRGRELIVLENFSDLSYNEAAYFIKKLKKHLEYMEAKALLDSIDNAKRIVEQYEGDSTNTKCASIW